MLDEPTNHLYITYQIYILRLVRNLGISCLAVLHDIVMAAHYVYRLYFLKDGTIVSEGTPEDIVTPELLADVYGVEHGPPINCWKWHQHRLRVLIAC